MLGVLAVLILEVALSPAQMLRFGWRLPFLASVVSASAALALRLHMPEPTEFLQVRTCVFCCVLGRRGHRKG
jgi:MHS family proline/betaine transporter-like MFS transporter